MSWFDFRPRTTPTQLAQMMRCEQQMLFKRKSGDKMNAKRMASARNGTKVHLDLEKRGEIFLAGNKGGKQCFIATAVYGEDARQTNLLRQYRDDFLLTSKTGQALVRGYYTISPPVAKLLCHLPFLKPLVKLALWPIIILVNKCS